MNALLSFLFPLANSQIARVLFDLVGPNGEIGVRRRPFPWELIIVLGAGIVIIVLIILAVRYLVRIRKNNKAKDD